jgi:hypothetical protein
MHSCKDAFPINELNIETCLTFTIIELEDSTSRGWPGYAYIFQWCKMLFWNFFWRGGGGGEGLRNGYSSSYGGLWLPESRGSAPPGTFGCLAF